MELYKKHRPKTLDTVIGQVAVTRPLAAALEKGTVPHALLFTGPSGCGKTTIARIVGRALGARKGDFVELNSADFRGVDTVREIRRQVGLAPMFGKARVWVIDECHKLTNDAQNALLKLLEDPPAHVWIMLATTEPNKLLRTIRTRCTEHDCKPLSDSLLEVLCQAIASQEKIQLGEPAISKLVRLAEGSARKALVLLESIANVKPKDQEETLAAATHEQEAIEIARALLARSSWPKVAALLKPVDHNDVESIRHLVLSYATAVILGGGPKSEQAALMLEEFRNHFYDSRKPGLVLACYRTIMLK